MLAGDAVDVQWQNPIDRFDVNNDSRLTPSDAHIIANAMLANGRRRLILPETGFAKGAYPDVKLDALVSRADFDMVVWEMDRRARESEAGGGMGMLSGDNYPPSATHGIADFLRWGESDEIDTVFGYELFDDPDHEDTELTFAAFVSGDINIIDDIIFNPSTGEYDIYYVLGEWGTATITLRATDPEAAYAEVWFDVTSVLVLDYDLQWKDQGTWVGIPSDQGILTNDELRGRMYHTPIPPEFVVSIGFKHKEWLDAEGDVDANDAVSGLWQYPLITDGIPTARGVSGWSSNWCRARIWASRRRSTSASSATRRSYCLRSRRTSTRSRTRCGKGSSLRTGKRTSRKRAILKILAAATGSLRSETSPRDAPNRCCTTA